jgi:hypothetical protein
MQQKVVTRHFFQEDVTKPCKKDFQHFLIGMQQDKHMFAAF